MRLLLRVACVLSLALGATSPLLLAPPSARASTVEAMSMRDLVRESNDIFVCEVIGQQAHYDERQRIVTDYTVRVTENLHGQVRRGSTAIVRRIGGEVGDLGLRVEGEAVLIPGESVLLFARRIAVSGVPGGSILRPVGMSQGVMPISNQSGGTMILPGGEGLGLVSHGPDGRIEEGQPALTAPRAQDELLAEVRELVRAIHGS